MRTILSIIVAVLALTVMAPGHAEGIEQNFFTKVDITESTTIDSVVTQTRDTIDYFIRNITQPWVTFTFTEKDEQCLARNIYFEAGGESTEGKAAVGIVTVNRVKDGRFGRTICEVVNQRTLYVRSTVITETEMVQTGWFGGTKPVERNRVVINHVPVCQFSWVCAFVRVPRVTNPAWEESQAIAHELLADGFASLREKYGNALYFHSVNLRPVWTTSMSFIAREGRHRFYTDRF